MVAAQVMDQYRGTPFEQDLRKALVKISEILPATIEVPLDVLTGCLSVLPREVQTTYDPDIFRVLVTAVRQSRQLSMVYWTAGRNETQKRTFDPYDLVLAPDDDWCLIGHCHLRNDIRLFKVQRCAGRWRRVMLRRPAGFRARDYMAESFGTIRGDGDFHVALGFTQAYAGLIAEKQWHAGQVVEPQPDGTLILRLHVNDLRLIKRRVMFWGVIRCRRNPVSA